MASYTYLLYKNSRFRVPQMDSVVRTDRVPETCKPLKAVQVISWNGYCFGQSIMPRNTSRNSAAFTNVKGASCYEKYEHMEPKFRPVSWNADLLANVCAFRDESSAFQLVGQNGRSRIYERSVSCALHLASFFDICATSCKADALGQLQVREGKALAGSEVIGKSFKKILI